MLQNPTGENSRDINHHKRAAALFEEAASFHLESAKFYENGDEYKACQSTRKALWYSSRANKARRERIWQTILTGLKLGIAA